MVEMFGRREEGGGRREEGGGRREEGGGRREEGGGRREAFMVEMFCTPVLRLHGCAIILFCIIDHLIYVSGDQIQSSDWLEVM